MTNVNLPAGMGGLMNFKEEYASRFNLKPVQVIIFIILIIGFRIGMEFFIK